MVNTAIFSSGVRPPKLTAAGVSAVAVKKINKFPLPACNIDTDGLYYINVLDASPSSRGLGQRVLIPPTPVRIRVEMPILKLFSTGIKVPVFLFKDFGL